MERIAEENKTYICSSENKHKFEKDAGYSFTNKPNKSSSFDSKYKYEFKKHKKEHKNVEISAVIDLCNEEPHQINEVKQYKHNNSHISLLNTDSNIEVKSKKKKHKTFTEENSNTDTSKDISYEIDSKKYKENNHGTLLVNIDDVKCLDSNLRPKNKKRKTFTNKDSNIYTSKEISNRINDIKKYKENNHGTPLVNFDGVKGLEKKKRKHEIEMVERYRKENKKNYVDSVGTNTDLKPNNECKSNSSLVYIDDNKELKITIPKSKKKKHKIIVPESFDDNTFKEVSHEINDPSKSDISVVYNDNKDLEITASKLKKKKCKTLTGENSNIDRSKEISNGINVIKKYKENNHGTPVVNIDGVKGLEKKKRKHEFEMVEKYRKENKRNYVDSVETNTDLKPNNECKSNSSLVYIDDNKKLEITIPKSKKKKHKIIVPESFDDNTFKEISHEINDPNKSDISLVYNDNKNLEITASKLKKKKCKTLMGENSNIDRSKETSNGINVIKKYKENNHGTPLVDIDGVKGLEKKKRKHEIEMVEKYRKENKRNYVDSVETNTDLKPNNECKSNSSLVYIDDNKKLEITIPKSKKKKHKIIVPESFDDNTFKEISHEINDPNKSDISLVYNDNKDLEITASKLKKKKCKTLMGENSNIDRSKEITNGINVIKKYKENNHGTPLVNIDGVKGLEKKKRKHEFEMVEKYRKENKGNYVDSVETNTDLKPNNECKSNSSLVYIDDNKKLEITIPKSKKKKHKIIVPESFDDNTFKEISHEINDPNKSDISLVYNDNKDLEITASKLKKKKCKTLMEENCNIDRSKEISNGINVIKKYKDNNHGTPLVNIDGVMGLDGNLKFKKKKRKHEIEMMETYRKEINRDYVDTVETNTDVTANNERKSNSFLVYLNDNKEVEITILKPKKKKHEIIVPESFDDNTFKDISHKINDPNKSDISLVYNDNTNLEITASKLKKKNCKTLIEENSNIDGSKEISHEINGIKKYKQNGYDTSSVNMDGNKELDIILLKSQKKKHKDEIVNEGSCDKKKKKRKYKNLLEQNLEDKSNHEIKKYELNKCDISCVNSDVDQEVKIRKKKNETSEEDLNKKLTSLLKEFHACEDKNVSLSKAVEKPIHIESKSGDCTGQNNNELTGSVKSYIASLLAVNDDTDSRINENETSFEIARTKSQSKQSESEIVENSCDIMGIEFQQFTEEEMKILDNLYVFIPWTIPISHTIETRISSNPTKEQMNKFAELGIKMKSGPYNKEEDEKIRQNWSEFCKHHDLDSNNPKLFFEQKIVKKSTIPYSERLKFARYLGKGLENRTLYSIYHRFQKLFSDIVKGRFTPEEDAIILLHVKQLNFPNIFSLLSFHLNRSRQCINKRSITLLANDKKVCWDFDKMEQLIKNLLSVTNTTEIEQLRDFKIETSHWKEIETKMAIPALKLRLKWESYLHPRLFISDISNVTDLQKAIINKLYESNIADRKNVYWIEIAKDFPGLTGEKLSKVFRDLMANYVPKILRNDFRGCVTFLKELFASLKTNRRRILKLKFKNGRLYELPKTRQTI